MRSEDLGDGDLELDEFLVSGVGAESLLERTALIHGGGGDNAVALLTAFMPASFPGVSFISYLLGGQVRISRAD